ncbi:tape measure protein [uncultured Megasphaera sp.]|uniref:tape measure protein n=1 Tax=uncultured Megasphaera sp. TaxID=165188 RepID=UPI0026599736|nr:tape measure protein [uncultured Megasphaera sp.]
MATIENYIRLRDGFSPVLDRISQASSVVARRLDAVSGAAREAGESAESASSRFGMLKSVFAGSFLADAAMQGIEAISNGINNLVGTADEYAGIQARLSLIAGSQENVAYLNNMIFESAQRARGGYLDMARAVSQLSLSAHDAFPDPREAAQFMEGIQKMFVIGGVNKQNQQDAMIQLTQGLASGQLQGDEFRSIAENAPIIENMIAKEMGVPRGALKQLAAEGEVTADVIRNAILNNMDEINAQFAAMPKRWGDHFTELTNIALREFAPVFTRLNDLANSEGVRFFVNNIEWGISQVAPMFYAAVGVIQWFVDTAAGAISYVGDFFNTHAWAAEAALGALGLALLYVGLNALFSAGQMGIAAVATGAKTIADWAETAAIIAMTLAQEGLNAALALCPVTWIIGAIVILIGIFYLAVAAVNRFAGTSLSATGLIFGAFAWMGTGILNTVKMVANSFIALANFLGSVFQDPLGAAYNLFVDIWNAIVEYVAAAVNDVIGLVNKIPGMHINAVSAGDLTAARKEIAGAAFYVTPFTYDSANGAAAAGYSLGASDWTGSIKDAMKQVIPETYDTSKITPAANYDPNAANNAQNAKRTADNTGRMADTTARMANAIEMTDEEIRELRDSAMQQVISEWQQQHITIHIENQNNVASDVDIDGMTSDLVKGIQEAVAIQREGVRV